MNDVLSDTVKKARKKHICDFCGCPIEIGEMYANQSIACDGSVYTWKAHIICMDALSIFDMDNGWGDGVDWQTFQDCISQKWHETQKDGKDLSVLEKVKILIEEERT